MFDFIANRFFTLTGIHFFLGIVIHFVFISMVGWLIEMIYLGTSGKGIINAGFLQGPFCPAYATGALIIYPFTVFFAPLPPWFQLVLFAIMAVIIEYIASLALEKILGLRIWDYSDEPFNLHGRVSLKYAFFWFFLVLLLVFILQPISVLFIEAIPEFPRNIIGSIIFLLIITDFIYSAFLYRKTTKCIKETCAQMDFPEKELYELQFNRTRIMNEKKRIKELFKQEEYDRLNKEILEKIYIPEVFEKDPEFINSIRDIIEHPDYVKWYNQSERTSLLFGEHLRIAELVWKFGSFQDIDKRAAARGTLLSVYHRVKLYPREMFGRYLFPQIFILRWVKKDLFNPNHIEKDIILRYKWPLNIKAPSTREGLLVSFADKIIKSKEFRMVVKDLYSAQLSS